MKGKTVVVTGGSSGIGQAIALSFGEKGARVVVNYHSSRDEAEETAKRIEEAGGEAFAFQADVGNEEDVRKMFEVTCSKFGIPDVVICNAGIQKDNAFSEMTLKEWEVVLNTNLSGYFLCAREAVRLMTGKKNSNGRTKGSIIMMSSVHDIIPWAGHVNYAASKGGVLMLMKSLALEVAPLGIRVNAISPGAIKTDINKEVWEDEAKEKELLKLIPYKRLGEPQDVAEVACWLASEGSDYVTGTTIYVDGGMTLYPGFVDNG